MAKIKRLIVKEIYELNARLNGEKITPLNNIKIMLKALEAREAGIKSEDL